MHLVTNEYLKRSVVECPVAIVLAEDDERKNATTVSFFSELTDHSKSLWISLSPDSYSHELVQSSGRFTLAVLHDGQRDYAWTCALSSGRDTNKLADLETRRGPEDFLYLDDSLAAVACQVRSSRPVGDHVLYVADIVAGEVEAKNSTRRALLIRDLL